MSTGSTDDSGSASANTGEMMQDSGPRAVIETLQSIVVAFVLAFAFRSIVVEPFVIPTGSMAPTLLGAHLQARGPNSGYAFPIGPRDQDRQTNLAATIQGENQRFEVADPMLDNARYAGGSYGPEGAGFENAKIQMGDRILVLKYLYAIFEPRRFDVVVFKYPENPTENFIKRLIGLPGETIWLADGDVFVSTNGLDGDFSVRRKPEHVQKRVWQPVFRSEYAPVDPDRIRPRWQPPWISRDDEDENRWEIGDARMWRLNSELNSSLDYDHRNKPIVDHYPYNSSSRNGPRYEFSVSDIRLAATLRPDQEGLSTSIRLNTRRHDFEVLISADEATLRMRPEGIAERASWTDLGQATIKGGFAPAGEATSIEVWHVDQAWWLWIDDDLILHEPYGDDWSADRRLELATGLSATEVIQKNLSSGNVYVDKARPSQSRLSWSFSGSPLTMTRVELDRDLYYRPAIHPDTRGPALATHPLVLPVLTSDQYFVCGDNCPSSSDGRLWPQPDPWIAEQIDSTPGVVPRELMLGKAFFVYFPSPHGLTENGTRFVPNFGSMRFIH